MGSGLSPCCAGSPSSTPGAASPRPRGGAAIDRRDGSEATRAEGVSEEGRASGGAPPPAGNPTLDPARTAGRPRASPARRRSAGTSRSPPAACAARRGSPRRPSSRWLSASGRAPPLRAGGCGPPAAVALSGTRAARLGLGGPRGVARGGGTGEHRRLPRPRLRVARRLARGGEGPERRGPAGTPVRPGGRRRVLARLGVGPCTAGPSCREEDREGANRVVIVSDGLWRAAFAANLASSDAPFASTASPTAWWESCPPALSRPVVSARRGRSRSWCRQRSFRRLLANRGDHETNVIARLRPARVSRRRAPRSERSGAVGHRLPRHEP